MTNGRCGEKPRGLRAARGKGSLLAARVTAPGGRLSRTFAGSYFNGSRSGVISEERTLGRSLTAWAERVVLPEVKS